MSNQNLAAKYEEQIIAAGIKICISCGSICVIINDDTMTCLDCRKQFKFKEKQDGLCL